MAYLDNHRTCRDCKAHFSVESYGSPAEDPGLNYCTNCGSANLQEV
jgi:hypothetical protein